MKTFLPLLCLVFSAPGAIAQLPTIADDGTVVHAAPAPGNGNTNRAPGSLTTHFNGGNGFAGNMFDITTTTDLEITGIDFHARNNTNLFDIDLWYRVGTCVGNDLSPAGWILLGQVTGVMGAGAYGPTFADFSGNGVVFAAGQTYGIYMDNVNYSTSGGINYTNGVSTPETYSNADITLDAYYGKATPSFTGSTFTPRVWNGTIYYDSPGGGAPTLAITNLVAGAVASVDCSNCTPGGIVYFVWSAAGGGPVSTPFGTGYVSPPFNVIPLTADSAGNANMTQSVPPGISGMNLWFHGADLISATLLNPLALVVG